MIGIHEGLDQLAETVRRIKNGEAPPAAFRAGDAPLGVYEQRQPGSYMVRVRLPGGVIRPEAMRALARTALRHGSGPLHATTRQSFQIYNVPLEGIPAVLADLEAGGLSARGACGNSVRNVTACPHAGACPGEPFDVTPYAVALSEWLLRDPASFGLPRKFKIAFSGCPDDCAGAAVHDLGFIARTRDGHPGFAVYAGGGMGANVRAADLIEEFVPGGEIHLVAEAVKRVFDRHGDRLRRHRARLRFLVAGMGIEAFRSLYRGELELLRRERPAGPDLPTASESPSRQDGQSTAEIPLLNGDIDPGILERLADVVERHGEGQARLTQEQNLLLRGLEAEERPSLHAELAALGLAEPMPATLRRAVACAGAATCPLGICRARGLLAAVRREMERAEIDLPEASGLRLNINGCPNACGRHPIASIGLVGAARSVGGRPVPHYVIQLGGRLGEGRARMARGAEAVPARNVPKFLVEFLEGFRASPRYPDFDAFLDAGGRELAGRIAARHKEVPPFEKDPSFYRDWGAAEPFAPPGRAPGAAATPPPLS